MSLLFADEFDTLSMWNGSSYSAAAGTWSSNFWMNEQSGRGWSLIGRSNGSSHNQWTGGPGPGGSQEWYIDYNYAPTDAVNPWTVDDGVLAINLDRVDPAIKPLLGYDGWNGFAPMPGQFDYTSGLMKSMYSFSFQYGYVEFRAQMPNAWGALWLLPTDKSDDIEIDVMESFQSDPSLVMQTLHSKTLPTAQGVSFDSGVDLTEGMHVYAVDWTAEHIDFYFDGQLTAHYATPSNGHKPMYLIMNVQLGGTWQGNDFSNLDIPTAMLVDYVRVWDANPYAADSSTPVSAAPKVDPPVAAETAAADPADQFALPYTDMGWASWFIL